MAMGGKHGRPTKEEKEKNDNINLLDTPDGKNQYTEPECHGNNVTEALRVLCRTEPGFTFSKGRMDLEWT